jgi:beta-N-acetylhexosaminidase
MNLRHLQRAPFRLTAAELAWVERTFARMTRREQLAQLLVPLAIDTSPANLERFASLGVGGLFRLPTRPPAAMAEEAFQFTAASAVPPLLCADLEFGERGAIGGSEGTAFPNQLAVSAAGLPAVERMAILTAEAGRATGFNWSFTPVADLDLNRHNVVVSTRSFGDNPAHVARCVRAYVQTLQSHGMAACAKHWPGDGAGDLDQHYTPSTNPLSMEAWNRTFGRVFRAAVRAGVLSVMSGHITLPSRAGAGRAPASVSRQLNEGMLRGELDFNGVIICDASSMAGLTVHAPREQLVPRVIANGCDMLLFPIDPELDLEYLMRAVDHGALTSDRVDQAVLRVLALKAKLDLPRHERRPRTLSPAVKRRHQRWAEETAQAAVTLVRDQMKLLPLNPRRHRRVLLIQQENRMGWSGPLPPLQIEALLRSAGFSVARYNEPSDVQRDQFDVAIWVTAEEAAVGKHSLNVSWAGLLGRFPGSMMRTWPELPTILVSLGYPWHVREFEGCPVVINAYSPVPAMQRAVVQALIGHAPFSGVSPVKLP